MQVQYSKTSRSRNRISGFLRLFVLSLLTAAFSFTSLHAQTVAYVANFDSNSVSVIDTATNTVTATIPVGNRPLGVVFSPDGARAYVTNQTDGTISVINTASNTVVATITVETGGGALELPAITPDGKSLYAPDENNGLFVVSTATNSVVATIPAPGTAVAITPDGTRAYVLTLISFLSGIPEIDTATNTIVTTVTGVQGVFSVGIADTPNGLTIYATGGPFGSISAIATSSNTVTATIPFNGTAGGIVVTPDGSRAYVTSPLATFQQVVGVIDTATNTQEATTIAAGSSSGFASGGLLAVTPDGAFVYVTNGGDGTVSVIDTSTNTVVATVTVGTSPFGIAIANLSTPFSQFSITGLTVNKKGFTESGTVTLGANSSGLNLAAQPVTLTVDGFSLTIPGGSFKQVGGNMHFVFSGTINGQPVSMTLMAINGTNNSFKYSVTVNGVDLTGQPNPATVGLKIGSNSGSTTAPF